MLLDGLRPIGAPRLPLGIESRIAALGAEGILAEVLARTGAAGERAAEAERLAGTGVGLSCAREALSGAGIRLPSSGGALPGTEAAAALHCQLLGELMERETDLLCRQGVHGEVLRELPEQRDRMLCWIVRSGGTGEGAEERVMYQGALQELALEVRVRLQELTLGERILQSERILHERVRLRAEGIRLALAGLCGIRGIGAICAGLAKQPWAHLRRPRCLQSGKRIHQALRGIL